jgi:hypothetical protein
MKRSSVFIAMMSMFLSFSLGAMRKVDERVMSVKMQDLQDVDYPIVMVVGLTFDSYPVPRPFSRASYTKWQYGEMEVKQLLYPSCEKSNESKGDDEKILTYCDIKDQFTGHVWYSENSEDKLSLRAIQMLPNGNTEELLGTTKIKFNGKEKDVYLLDEELIKKRDGDSKLDEVTVRLLNYNKKDYGEINELRQLCIAEKNYILSDLINKDVCWSRRCLSFHEKTLKLLCERITLIDGEIDDFNKNSKKFLRQILFAGGALLFLLGIVYKVHLIKNS